MAGTIKEYIQELSLPESFAEAHIPIREVLENNIYLLNNGDLGVVYKFDGIYDEPLTRNGVNDVFFPFFKFLRQIVLGVPMTEQKQNIVVQVICSQRIAKALPKPQPDKSVYEFSDTDVGRFLKTEEERLFSLGLFERHFYIALRYVAPKAKSTLLDAVALWRSPEAIAKDEQRALEAKRELFEIALEPLELEMNVSRRITRLTTRELFAHYHDVLHGGRGGQLLFCDEDKNLHENIYNPPLESTPSGLLVDDNGEKINIDVFVMSQLPTQYSLGQMRNFFDAMPCKSWDMVWVFSHGRGDAPKEILAKMWWFEKGTANRPKYNALQHHRENTSNVTPTGKFSWRLVTYGITKTQASRLQSLALDYLGARLVQEKQIGVHMLASSLPLGCLPAGNAVTGRCKSLRLEAALGFLPVYGGPPATKGVRWWASRSALPARFDLFAGEGNRMTSIIGRGRAGKSCLMTQILLEFLERFPNGMIRCIDRKTSYKKLSDLFSGKIIHFSEANLRENPYSPFALTEWDIDDMDNIYVLVASAILQKNPKAQMTAVHAEILLEAIKRAYNNQKMSKDYAAKYDANIAPHPIWPDVAAQLETAAQARQMAGAVDAARELAAWTISLTETGQYGFLFSRHEKAGGGTADARFLVYDLDGIADPALRMLAGQMAFLKISRDLAKLPRSTPKLVVIDEFGMLLIGDDEQTQKMNDNFVRNIVKTAAKFNTIVMSLTNDVSDYAEKPAGRTMWGQSCHKLFLPLGTDIASGLIRSYPDQFTEADVQILHSLDISRELRRSQVYVKSLTDTGNWVASLQVPLSPHMDALVTTDPTPCEFYEDLRADGYSPAEALRIMAEEHPYGSNIITKSMQKQTRKGVTVCDSANP